MSDPISSLLQRSLTSVNTTRGTDSASKTEKAGATAAVTSATTSTTDTAASATPVDQLDVSFFDEKAGTIATILNNISSSVSTVRDTQDRLSQITALLEQAGGIAIRARDTLKATSATEELPEAIQTKLDELSTRYAKVLNDIDATASETEVPPNLLQGENLVTEFDTSGRVTSETQGIFIGSRGLGLYPINFAESTAEEADQARATVSTAIDEVKLFKQQLGSDLNTLQTRQDFSLNAMQLLSSQTAAPVLPSSAEESANLLALQLRQQLSGTEYTMANDAQRSLLQQF